METNGRLEFSAVMPEAYVAADQRTMLVPTTQSIGMRNSSSTRYDANVRGSLGAAATSTRPIRGRAPCAAESGSAWA